MTKQLDFESIRLRISRARASVTEYEVIRTKTGYIATLYDGCWPYMENVKREDCQTCQGIGTTRRYKALAEALCRYKVKRWDGFHKSDPRALDGEMFLFEAFLPNGEKIRAEGSNAYPKYYREILKCLDDAACGPEEY